MMGLVGFVGLVVFTIQMLPGLRRYVRERSYNAPIERLLDRRISVRLGPPSKMHDALEALQQATATEEFVGGIPLYVHSNGGLWHKRTLSPAEIAEDRATGAWLNSAVDLDVRDRPAREVLVEVLEPGGLAYRIDYGAIIVAAPGRLRQLPKVQPREWYGGCAFVPNGE